MVTTVVILEVFVMGALTLAWLSLFCIRFGFLDPCLIPLLLSKPTQWLIFGAVVVAILAYQLGSVLNTATFGILEKVRGRAIKKSIFPAQGEEIRGVIYQKASLHFLQELDSQLRFIRLARSGLVNFTMLGISALSFKYVGIGILSLALGVGCYPTWCTIYRFYQLEEYSVFKAIKGDTAAPQPSPHETET